MASVSFSPITDEVAMFNTEYRLDHALGSSVWLTNSPDKYTDLIMAYSSTNFGHCQPKIIEAVTQAANRADNIISFNDPQRDELSSRLISKLPFVAEDYQVYYAVGGAKGVDSAVKVARIASGKPGVICFANAFHGLASSLIGITDPKYVNSEHKVHQQDVFTLPFPVSDTEVDSSEVIKQLLALLDTDEIGTIIIEPVQGAAGFLQAPSAFFAELQTIVTKHHLILIVDDIQMGMGRTGEFYSFGRYELKPDLVLLGKSLAGGYYPLTAMIGKRSIFNSVGPNRSGLDSTFSNNAFGIQIANKVTQLYDELNIEENVRNLSHLFSDGLDSLLSSYPQIQAVSLIGLAASLQFSDEEAAIGVKNSAFRNHLIVQTAGINGNYIKLSPCLLISPVELKQAMELLDKSIAECFAKV
jgi:4-aminobutyrate aminotransferase-like enzyme